MTYRVEPFLSGPQKHGIFTNDYALAFSWAKKEMRRTGLPYAIFGADYELEEVIGPLETVHQEEAA